MTTHPHEIEEAEFRSAPRLWDADPDVCCAAFQLGACPHTEDDREDPTWGEVFAAWDPDVDGQGNEGLSNALDRLGIEEAF